ncbi:VOC family protein [Microlunatus spumicola]|uniref:VOC family protein n=1 Tax=Microlunatus spumicola TaxID=81499 RepID=A0ABP6Y9I0_9ACTN
MSAPEHHDQRAARVVLQDLCVDVTDLDAAAAFLGPLLGLKGEERRPTVLRLGDGVPAHTVWLNLVAEPRTVKNRVHLDVDVAAVDDVVALGARVSDDRFPWTVLTHDQAGELCAFVRPPERLRAYRLHELVVDCRDPDRLAAWWAERFGVEAQTNAEDTWIEGGGLPWAVNFVPVPEAKTVKNRVHWDVVGSTDELLAAGATLLRTRDDEIAWDVLADVEGNEFCVFRPSS